jgi:hypothetical protein
MPMIVITKTVGDLKKRPKEHVKSHPKYPLEVKEYPTSDEALEAHPGARLWTLEEYQGFKLAMNLTHGEIKLKRPWWKLWGNK